MIVKFTKITIKDLSEIWNYTANNWSERQANIYYELIIKACSAIAKKPHLGKDYNEIFPELKGKKLSKHIIFYRILDKNSIEITRILHEQMDLKNKLDK